MGTWPRCRNSLRRSTMSTRQYDTRNRLPVIPPLPQVVCLNALQPNRCAEMTSSVSEVDPEHALHGIAVRPQTAGSLCSTVNRSHSHRAKGCRQFRQWTLVRHSSIVDRCRFAETRLVGTHMRTLGDSPRPINSRRKSKIASGKQSAD